MKHVKLNAKYTQWNGKHIKSMQTCEIQPKKECKKSEVMQNIQKWMLKCNFKCETHKVEHKICEMEHKTYKVNTNM